MKKWQFLKVFVFNFDLPDGNQVNRKPCSPQAPLHFFDKEREGASVKKFDGATPGDWRRVGSRRQHKLEDHLDVI